MEMLYAKVWTSTTFHEKGRDAEVAYGAYQKGDDFQLIAVE